MARRMQERLEGRRGRREEVTEEGREGKKDRAKARDSLPLLLVLGSIKAELRGVV